MVLAVVLCLHVLEYAWKRAVLHKDRSTTQFAHFTGTLVKRRMEQVDRRWVVSVVVVVVVVVVGGGHPAP